MKAVLGVTLLCACIATDAAAQYSSGRHSRSGQGDSQQKGDPAKTITPDDPFSAIERELPSLSLDVALTSAQLGAWNAFQRDVRDIAEMDRARRRHLLAMQNGDSSATAITFVGALAEDDRLRAEATRELQKHVETLYAMLSDAQKRVFDKRLILSQTDPLGR